MRLIKELRILTKSTLFHFRNLLYAYVWYKKHIKQVPKFWEVSYQRDSFGYGRLLIIHHSQYDSGKEIAPLVSFIELCKTAGKIGVIFNKEFSQYVGIKATSKNPIYLKGRKKKIIAGFNLDITQCQYDKCDIEYVEETVKRPKLIGLCADLIK